MLQQFSQLTHLIKIPGTEYSAKVCLHGHNNRTEWVYYISYIICVVLTWIGFIGKILAVLFFFQTMHHQNAEDTQLLSCVLGT